MSDFNINSPLKESKGIDFQKAKRIATSGTICDAYEMRYFRRHVFVKRLKEEFRRSPRHLAALEKEYEIASGLSHPSLPRYSEFHDEYIVMDYIDGLSLAQLISHKDNRLMEYQFVTKILYSLLDVLSYLHHHNIIHSDLKPDNIMITNELGNIVVIDFDKCYTSWLDDTPGSSENYGVSQDKTGSVVVDFHGLGKVAEKLSNFLHGSNKEKILRFRDDCFKSGITDQELMKDLEGKKHSLLWLIVILFMVLSGLIIFIPSYKTDRTISPDTDHLTSKDTVVVISKSEASPAESITNVPETKMVRSKTSSALKSQDLTDEEKGRILDKRLSSYFQSLNEHLLIFKKGVNDSTLSSKQLLELSDNFTMAKDNIMSFAYSAMHEAIPGIEPMYALKTMVLCSHYRDFMHRASEIEKKAFYEIQRRASAERDKNIYSPSVFDSTDYHK